MSRLVGAASPSCGRGARGAVDVWPGLTLAALMR